MKNNIIYNKRLEHTIIRVIILTPFYKPVKGGITSFLFNLTSMLKNNFCDLDVNIIAKECDPDKNVFSIKKNKFLFVTYSTIFLLQKKPHVLHANSNWYCLAPCIIYKILYPRTKIIFTFHTEPIQGMSGIKKIIFNNMFSICDTITFASKALMEKISNELNFNVEKKVVYAGFSAIEMNKSGNVDKFKSKFRLTGCSPIVTFIGPLVFKKKSEGVARLIQAMADVVKKYPNAKLLIIGDGKYINYLKELANELNLIDNIIFTGYLDDVYAALALTDIYAHISLQEGLPLSLLEAMGSGKPVIATKIGGIPEVVVHDENGILVEPYPKAISKAIIELYENEDLRNKLKINAQKTIKDKFDWEKTALEFYTIYKGNSNEEKNNYYSRC